MGKKSLDPFDPGLPPKRRPDRFVSAVTTAIVAMITVGMRNVGMRYFEGNVLGFIGLCTVIVIGVYAIYFSVIWFAQRSDRR